MNRCDLINAELVRLERWKRIAFAAACAERLAVVFRSFGSPESQALYKEGLDLAWQGVTHDDLVPQAKRFIEKIYNAPEAEEDLKGSIYYSQSPLILVAYALETQVRSEPERVTWASGQGLNFRSELDAVLEGPSEQTVAYPPGEWPPDGPLLKLEFQHQYQILELLKSAQKPDAELIGLLRHLAQEANKDLEFVVSEIRQGRY
jgi:uncharacterized protein YjaG (DUF416 family)